uniref:Uncharacterized protein n=2 Tax=Candidatus Kentrum sp. SD TaxID=2126332 RepID=A0A450YHE5_9GAMM|nr:MAG: hypothetical protein BECKSD772F_GA0070984_10772 [Candidatus Kentron sp. SD]VFK80049.1 MAG: hypothetical protein BECKSD772D_GA0070982_10822 [Candidatus Kentron sp. SD]
MEMIFRTPNNDWRAFQFLRDTTRPGKAWVSRRISASFRNGLRFFTENTEWTYKDDNDCGMVMMFLTFYDTTPLGLCRGGIAFPG